MELTEFDDGKQLEMIIFTDYKIYSFQSVMSYTYSRYLNFVANMIIGKLNETYL